MKILNFYTLSSLILLSTVSISHATPAPYSATSEPKVWVGQIYASYLAAQHSTAAINQPENFTDVIIHRATPQLSKLLKLENTCTQQEGICALDHDFIVAGQDYEIKKLTITKFITDKNKGYLKVNFENFHVPTQVTFEFLKINNNWKINNIISGAINQQSSNLQHDLQTYFNKPSQR